MNEIKESPGTRGTEAITSSSHNLNGVRLDEQSNKIYDSLFDVPAQMSEDPALDALIPEETPGDLEKSELLRQATQAACAHIRRLRERGSTVTPSQIEKLVLSMMNSLIVQHNKETKARLPRYQELPPTVLAEVFAFEQRVVLVGTGEPTKPSKLPLAVYQVDGELEGTYQLLDEGELHGLLRPYCHSITVRQAAETHAHLRAIVPVIDEMTEPYLVPVKNGIFNTATKELEAFTPERVFLTKSPVAYNANATSPVKTLNDGTSWEFDTWLADLFSDDKERVELFWQIAASSLRVYKCLETAFFFYSENGSSGKSTLLFLMRHLLGERNCVSLSLSEFGDRFGCEPLLGASAVFGDETDTYSFMRECKNFKKYVTHDVLSVARKGQVAISWKPRGLVVLAGNDLPEFSDKTEAMTRRFIFVPFDKCFTGVQHREIRSEFMIAKDVQEYVLRRALELAEFEYYTEGKATRELREEVKFNNDPVFSWWEEQRESFVTPLVPWDFAYAVYEQWYAKNFPRQLCISRKEFVKRMRAVAHGSATWRSMGAKDTALVISQYWATNQEPLAVRYGLSQWMSFFDLSRGLPEALKHTPRVRGLLRVGTASAPAQPAPVSPPAQPVHEAPLVQP